MKPLLAHLQILKMDTTSDQAFLKMLPLWCCELRKLALKLSDTQPKEMREGLRSHRYERLKGLYQSFEKLEEFELDYSKLQVDDIEEILKANRQMKKVNIQKMCSVAFSPLRCIVNRLPQVESLIFGMPVINELHPDEYSVRLKNLKYLDMDLCCAASLGLVVSKIAFETNPLETLYLRNPKWTNYIDRNIEKISKLESLKTLGLACPNLQKNLIFKFHIFKICKHSTQLRYLDLLTPAPLTPEIISEIIQNAVRLDTLAISPSMIRVSSRTKTITVNSGHYSEWKQIAEQRRKNKSLQIRLHGNLYATNMTASPIRKGQKSFSVVIGSTEIYDGAIW